MTPAMPSPLNEGILDAFRNRPGLAGELLPVIGWGDALPDTFDATLESSTLTESIAAELQADLLVVLRDREGAATLVIVLEVQLKVDRRKRYTCPRYLVAAHSRYACPALLMVVAASERVARWARTPLQLGPGSTVQPAVLGPSQVPQVTDAETACAAPELALLSLLAHRGDVKAAPGILLAAEQAFARLPEDLSRLYFDLGRAHLGDRVRRALEEHMAANGYQYQSEFARKYYAQGREEGREERDLEILPTIRSAARELLTVRFGPLPAPVLDKLEAAEVDTLIRWLHAAQEADSLEQLMAGD